MAEQPVNAHQEPLYPWLRASWRRLLDYRQGQRMPQALLIIGRQGLGKRRLAESFASLLLCDGADDLACGHCHSCRLLAAGTHPDYLLAEPNEPGKAIGVDAMRDLIEKLALKAQYGGRRVVVIDPAHLLNAAAANCLLKTLEEPPEQTLMLLLTSMPSHVPPTLRSRCQRLVVPPPAHAEACAWLRAQDPSLPAESAIAAAGNAPLKALELAQGGMLAQRERLFDLWPLWLQGRADPVQEAEKLAKLPLDLLIDWLHSWACDAHKLAQSPSPAHLTNGDRLAQLQTAAGRMSGPYAQSFVELLYRCRRDLATNAQLNRQLLLEQLLMAWCRLARAGSGG